MPLPYCYEYPRPAVTVDIVACAFDGNALRVLLVRRRSEPHAGEWALPGGFMNIDEPLHEAALRELGEETGIDSLKELHMLGIYDAPKRDPRGRVLSVAFGALLPWPTDVKPQDDAEDAVWMSLSQVQELAFDHARILENGLHWAAFDVLTGNGAVALLPEPFTTQQARKLFRELDLAPNNIAPWLERLRAERATLPGPRQRARSKSASKSNGSAGKRKSSGRK